MSYLILGLGLLLSVCGSAAVYFGYGIVTVERGWSSLIAGATALSCGVITIALALILRSLTKLQAFLEAEKGTKPLLTDLTPSRAAIAPQPPEDLGFAAEFQAAAGDQGPADRAQPPAAAREAAVRVAEAAPPFAEKVDIQRGPARILTPLPREDSRDRVRESVQDSVQEGANERAIVSRASIEDVRRLVAAKVKGWPQPQPQSASGESRKASFGGKAQPAPAPVYEIGAEPRPAGGRDTRMSSVVGSDASIDVARRADAKAAPLAAGARAQAQIYPAPFVATDEAPRGQVAPDAQSGGGEAASPAPLEEGLAIVGRYEADGTFYVMYADGSIDAQSDRGVFHFKSMADLKAFIETQG